MKKSVNSLLCLVLVACTLMFTACSSENETQTPETTSEVTTSEVTTSEVTTSEVTTPAGTTAGVATAEETENPASEGLAFLDYNDYYCIVKGIGSCTDTEIVIPKTHDGKTVVCINDKAFYNCTQITSVYIPKTVLAIEDEAFYGCSSLETVIFEENENPEYYICPMTVTREFMENEILKKIENDDDRFRIHPQMYVLYDTLSHDYPSETLQRWEEEYPIIAEKEIYALNEMATWSEKIKIEAVIKKWCPDINEKVIDEQHAETEYNRTGHLKQFDRIKKSAFENCTNLENINIPESVAYTHETAFSGCPKIQK